MMDLLQIHPKLGTVIHLGTWLRNSPNPVIYDTVENLNEKISSVCENVYLKNKGNTKLKRTQPLRDKKIWELESCFTKRNKC